MSHAIYRVYRPSTFADLIGQPHVSQTIQNQYAGRALAHAYLFTGPRGVGKTTTARLLAKLVNCEAPKRSEPCNACSACEQIAAGSALDVFEVDAASNTDVENVRENIIKGVRFAPNILKKKVFIIDEVHMLSASAFNALLKTLEEPPDHVLFILATTEIHKVPETIISRCQRFDFRRIPKQEMLSRLSQIVKQEGMEVDTDVLELIVKHSDGCARDAESLLGQVLALGDKKVTMNEASLVLPASTAVLVETFLGHLYARDARATVADVNEFLEQGIDLKVFLDDVLSALRERLFDDESGFVRQVITSLLAARPRIRIDHLPQLPVELAIIELCASPPFPRGDKEGFENSKDHENRRGPQTSPADVILNEPKDPEDFKQQEVASPFPTIPTAPASSLRAAEGGEAISLSTEPVEAVDQVFDSIPVISLDEVRQKWPEVFEQIRECNASLPLFMQSCEVCGVEGEHVELGFEYDLYVQTVNKDKNRQVIEDALARVLGRRIKVKAVAKKPSSDETVAGLLEEFGGTLT